MTEQPNLLSSNEYDAEMNSQQPDADPIVAQDGSLVNDTVANPAHFTHVHYDSPRGIHYGQSPDPYVQEWALDTEAKTRDIVQRLQETIDSAPNVNDRYGGELALVRSYFTDIGLSIAPLVVYDTRLREALRKIEDFGDDEGGAFIAGRATIYEGDKNTRDTYGADYVLSIALHEAAHSTAADSESRMIASVESVDEQGTRSLLSSSERSNGFSKPHREGAEVKQQGQFMEEAFADLTRVRALEAFGREPKLLDYTANAKDLGIVYVGEDATNQSDYIDGSPTVPARFLTVSAVQSNGSLRTGVPGIAAYGIELLDEALKQDDPSISLYDTMVASRADPTKQRDVIKIIDSVRPGLYQDLRQLSYTADGFRGGLMLIHEALAERSKTSLNRSD